MAYLLSSSEMIGRALRKIGAFPINDRNPDPVHAEEAEYWLDMILSEMVGTSRLLHRIEQAVTISLTTGTETYDLAPGTPDDDEDDPDLTQIPPFGIVHPVKVRLLVDDVDENEITMVDRRTYERIRAGAETGKPCWGTFLPDGDLKHKLKLYPTPTFSSGTMKVRMLVQQFFDDIVGNTDDVPKIGAEWQLYLVTRLAWVLGDGPVLRRPRGDIEDWKGDAEVSFARLKAFRAGQVETGPPVVESIW